MKRAQGGLDFCAGVDIVGDIVDEGGDGDSTRVCLGGAGDGFTVVFVCLVSLPIVIAERRGGWVGTEV